MFTWLYPQNGLQGLQGHAVLMSTKGPNPKLNILARNPKPGNQSISDLGLSENEGYLALGPYKKDPTNLLISGTILGSPIFGNSYLSSKVSLCLPGLSPGISERHPGAPRFQVSAPKGS